MFSNQHHYTEGQGLHSVCVILNNKGRPLEEDGLFLFEQSVLSVLSSRASQPEASGLRLFLSHITLDT